MIDYETVANAVRNCKFKTTIEECEACAMYEKCLAHKGFLDDCVAEIIKQLGKELDVALETIKDYDPCESCKYRYVHEDEEPCNGCYPPKYPKWEWRGVQE